MAGALEGLKVLDLTRVLAGPYASMILADLGADVVKVERPDGGDDARSFTPFVDGFSAYFASVNRGKRSITIDLKHPAGRRLLLRLAERADVLLENFRPGTMRRLGLDWQRLRRRNPRLIYAATSGFGQDGPYADRPAYDLIVQGMSGLVSITGEPGRPPVRVGTSIGDLSAALFTVIGILAALQARQRTGCGQMVDVAMLDSLLALLENAIARYDATGQSPQPLGGRHPAITPFQIVPTLDGWAMLAVGNDQLWAAFCRAAGVEELAGDPRFADNASRTANYKQLRPILEELTCRRTTAEWSRLLQAAGVPFGPINQIADVLADPQVHARQMVVEVSNGQAANVRTAGTPLKLSQTPARPARYVPQLGQHTEQVLNEWLGINPHQLSAVRLSGALGPPSKHAAAG